MKITHIAWLGYNNFGDDVMAYAIRQYLATLYENVNYTVWSEKKPKLSGHVKWIYPLNLKGRFVKNYFEKKALKKSDILLIGGGSIFHSQNSITWKQQAINTARIINPKIKVIGINLSVGPFASEQAEESCIKLLNSLDIASFRDTRSYNFALKAVRAYEPIESFDLAAYFLQTNNFFPKVKIDKINSIGVALKNSGDYNSSLKRQSEFLIKLSQKFKKVKLFSFCDFDNYGETKYLNDLVNYSGLNNLEIISYNGEPISFTKKIMECDFFIASRLHASIIAFLLNIPFISLSYHEKCLDFMKKINMSEKYFFNLVDFKKDEVINNIGLYNLPDKEKYFKASLDNFKVFDILGQQSIKK